MQDMRDGLVVLLAGGQGERLWPLTRDRAKPAVPFGALYRIIDITLSNCINSGLLLIFLLPQYKALGLTMCVGAGRCGPDGRGWPGSASTSKFCHRRCAFRKSGIRARLTRYIKIFIPSAANIRNLSLFFPAITSTR